MTIHQPTAAVRKSFGEAQQQAAAMVAGPPAPWNEASAAPRRSPLWTGIAALSIAAGGVAGWLGVDWFSSPTRASTPSSPAAAARVVAPAPAAPAALPATSFAPVVAPSSLAVTRQAGVIRIASTNANLADAVRALAQATHTEVKGAEALASITGPITLNWQGRDTAAAWDALLGRFASTAISCSGGGCELWIASVNAPRVVAGASVNGAAAMSEATPTPAAPIASPPQPQTQAQAQAQNSEENTETN